MEGRAAQEVVAPSGKIPLSFLFPLPIKRWAFLSPLHTGAGKIKAPEIKK